MVDPGTLIVFHDTGNWDGPVFGFGGADRYLRSHTVVSTRALARNAAPYSEVGPFVVLTFRASYEVPGWERRLVSSGLWLYEPPTSATWPADGPASLAAFADVIPPTRDIAMRLAAASVANNNGSIDTACAMLEPVRTDPDIWDSVVNDPVRYAGALQHADGC
jgi:hypothetical protein